MPTKGPKIIHHSTVDQQRIVDERMFAQAPTEIIVRYLEHFNSTADLVFEIPRYVLEALAIRLRRFENREDGCSSLDQAFGGKAAGQRRKPRAQGHEFEVAFWMINEMTGWKDGMGGEPGVNYETACERVGERLGMSADNAHRLYKNAKESWAA